MNLHFINENHFLNETKGLQTKSKNNVRWNTIPVCYVAIEKRKFKVICTCLLRS